MVEAIEEHHISHNPEIKVKISRREHQKIHNTLPNDSELLRKIRQYNELNKLIVSQKNWLIAFQKDFGIKPELNLNKLLFSKKKIIKEINELIKKELENIEHRGLSTIGLAEILAYAHPNRFPSLRKFLVYCGYKKSSKITHRYRREVCSSVNQTVKNMIMKRDSTYYSLYLKIKTDLITKYPLYRKGKIDALTRNRVGTFLLKEIYFLFRCRNSERSLEAFNSQIERSTLWINSQTTKPKQKEKGAWLQS